jgi:hypothetical protein
MRHMLGQSVELRKLFNDISIANGVDFVRHVFTKETTLADGTTSLATY